MTSIPLDATTAIAADRRRRLQEESARHRQAQARRRARLQARVRGTPLTNETATIRMRLAAVDLRALRSQS